MQHLNELGRIGLGSRMKRFSDYMMTEVNAIYKNAGIDFEASCFPLLSLLERYGPMSLRDAEQRLGTSHSYVSQKAKYLEGEGLIAITASQRDARSKDMHLTAEGIKLIEKARPCWKALDIAFARLLGDDERMIFQALTTLEKRLMDAPLLRRTVGDLLQPSSGGEVEIVDFQPRLARDFAELNLEWLEKSFTLMEFDHNVFADPKKYIIDKGGDIFFALLDGKAVGTAALYPESDDSFELCKMSVDPRHRGLGIGRKMVEEGIRRAQALGAKRVTLLTNSHKLAPAIRLYRSMGFQEIPMTAEDIRKYGEGRVDLRMELALQQPQRQARRR